MPLGQATMSVNPIGTPMPRTVRRKPASAYDVVGVRVRSCRCSPTLPKATGVQFTPDPITEVGEVTGKSTEQFLRDFMEAFEVFVTCVLSVLMHERLSTTAS
jgi:hypothetical protein